MASERGRGARGPASGPASGGSSARRSGDEPPHAAASGAVAANTAAQRSAGGRSGRARGARHDLIGHVHGGRKNSERTGVEPASPPRRGRPARLERQAGRRGPDRAGEPVGLLWSRLTPRDRDVLTLLERHRVLTTDQLRDLKFGSLRRAQQRMTELFELGVVWRFRYPLLGGGSQPWHYTLGYQGARLMTARRGEDPPRPQANANRLERLAESPKLRHLLGVNDFFVALAGHARRAGWAQANSRHGDGLRTWLSEQEISAHYEKYNASWLEGDRLRVRPDGFGRWCRHGRVIAFHLEHDTGTESVTRVAEKLETYTGGKDDYFAPFMAGMILFWLHSSRREKHLRTLLERHPTQVPVATAARDFGHPDGPAGPVWLLLNGPGSRVSLEQLPPILDTDDTGTPSIVVELRERLGQIESRDTRYRRLYGNV